MTLRVTDHAAASDVGRMRRANEDSYFVRAPLFVVADGMGGAQAGEVASKIAAEAFAAGLDESLAPERRLAEVVAAANREIHRHAGPIEARDRPVGQVDLTRVCVHAIDGALSLMSLALAGLARVHLRARHVLHLRGVRRHTCKSEERQ